MTFTPDWRGCLGRRGWGLHQNTYASTVPRQCLSHAAAFSAAFFLTPTQLLDINNTQNNMGLLLLAPERFKLFISLLQNQVLVQRE